HPPFGCQHLQERLDVPIQVGRVSGFGICRSAAPSPPHAAPDWAETPQGTPRRPPAARARPPRQTERCGPSFRSPVPGSTGFAAVAILACPSASVLAFSVMTRNTALKETIPLPEALAGR